MPRLAGLHPIYIARQLYLFKDGTRNGVDAQLMKKPVARLTDDDILNDCGVSRRRCSYVQVGRSEREAQALSQLKQCRPSGS